MKINKQILLFITLTLLSSVTFAYEGAYVSYTAPKARVAANGSLQIFGMPVEANCYSNKIGVSLSEDAEMRKMVLSLVMSAQLSSNKIRA